MRGQPSNLYRTLQVDPAAEEIVIRAAYRALMKRYHPDRGGDAAYARMLNAAYATLADPVARQAYDRMMLLRRPAAEPARPASHDRPLGGTRSLVQDLGEEVFRRFVPDFPDGLAGVWDFTGVLADAPRHRIWLKRFWRGDATEARAYLAAIEAARLSRPLWAWGSDFFVAVVPAASRDFRRLLRGPTGPLARFSTAVALYDLALAEVQAVGRTAELPTFRPFMTALEAGRSSASSTAPPNT